MRSIRTCGSIAQMRYLSVTRGREIVGVMHSYLLSVAAERGSNHFVFPECRELLKLGSSKPWPDAIRILTRGRTSRMDPGAILEYFEPLIEWLKKQNVEEKAGWSKLLRFPIRALLLIFDSTSFIIAGGMNSGILIKTTWIAVLLPSITLVFARLW